MCRLLTLVGASAFLLAQPLDAQGTLVVSQNKCESGRLPELRRMTDSLFIPIAQELVNEGKFSAVGSAYHAWGDEWNVVQWYTARDIPTFLSAWGELIQRVNQRHPRFMTQIQTWCTEHKDSFYSQGRATAPPG